MNPLRLIIASLVHFRKRNALLALGFAISSAVLTGALIVGDSVKFSLNKILEHRLGKVSLAMNTGDRFITEELINNLQNTLNSPIAGVLKLEGLAVADGGQKRLENIQVYGVDAAFDQMSDMIPFYSNLNGDSAIISQNIAERLNLQIGDDLLLRMAKASLVPLNAPFVSDADNIVSLRVTIKDIANVAQLGGFNLRTTQTSPFNLFINLDHLGRLMEIGKRCNLLLLADEQISKADLSTEIKEHWKPVDAGLKINFNSEYGFFDIKSERVFIDDELSKSLSSISFKGSSYLTYFVNVISNSKRSTPYSFVSTLQEDRLANDEIIINQWLAEDLKAKAGDSLNLNYFIVGPLRDLDTANTAFVIKTIIPIKGEFAEMDLMPDIPGMSDAGNCRDWETGVPIELESIRDKDEDYWTLYKGTPKAYISLPVAEKLWSNRFGAYTSFRIFADVSQQEQLVEELMTKIDPQNLGFEIKDVKKTGSYAANNGVDFSELFGGLSLFLLAGALLLSILLIRLNLDDRKEQVNTMTAMGIPFIKIRGILLNEILIVAIVASLIGLLLAIVYTWIIFNALNGIWIDIVRTDMLFVNIRIITLFTGYLISILIALVTVYFSLNSYLIKSVNRHIKTEGYSMRKPSGFAFKMIGFLLLLIAILLVVLQFIRQESVNAKVFFVSGTMFLISGISIIYGLLLHFRSKSVDAVNLSSLSLKNALSNLPRSMSIIVLLAMGTFIVISTGSNRKDLFANAAEEESGTGGFLFYAESTIPVLQNLNDSAVRYSFDLSSNYDIIQLRKADGDDASCLNLNKITNPRILGVNPDKLKSRFTFVRSNELLNEEFPWQTLSEKLSGDLIPAIADETVIKWGLGMSVGDTLIYQDASGNELKLLLVGGLAPSIFQGNVLISEENFLRHFPSHSGTQVFLIDGIISDASSIKQELDLATRDFGWIMELSAARLANFNSVSNTYLSIFMVLGALGLLLGTVGMAIVLFRSIQERKSELSLLQAVGYRYKTIRNLVIREYFTLLLVGSLIGSFSAILATLPSLLSTNINSSLYLIILIVFVLLINGLFWISLIARIALMNRSLINSIRNE